MPPKSKRKRSLEEAARRARESFKKEKLSAAEPSGDLSGQPSTSALPGVPTRSEREVSEPVSIATTASDATFDPDNELASDPTLLLEQYVEEWCVSLNREDKISLGLFITFHLERLMNFTQTNAAEYTAIMIGKSDRTIRQWKSDFMSHGEIPNNKQGHYQRTGPQKS